ncbi:acyl-CoA dehydrogenase [Enhydrobacter aerosaccus]|uniref:Acyl-CoA dehydrogenase n=1 Tax=Enhydrobacter aerosaccus TaxID=225324 RepID=A0A1T4LP24_9HYPH|nr:acyl-CoA dehydrogenase family protein [Enhydrobacter aerosaccus]SJZ56445.1 acyl-CoA dehydrogenase [Enhydrobacter aerosaccus]
MDRETRDMLLETADRFFTERCGREVVNGVEKGVWPADLWKEIEEMGLPLIAVDEDKGGAGGTLADMLALLRLAGAHAVPVPLAETALANLLVARAGGVPAAGPSTVALGALTLEGNRLRGTVTRVPFASVADRFVGVAATTEGPKVAVVPAANATVTETPSHAGEPYGTVSFDKAVCEFVGASPADGERAYALAALVRAMQMAGAADKVLGTAVEYCKQRVQFGRPISTFQAIQQMLAELASYVAATIAAAEAAARDADEGGFADGGSFSIAAAKSQTSDFAQRIAAIAHQSMGAMGFTHEHILHHYTRRLWVWRRDFGSETFWGEKIGSAFAKAGPQALWPSLTASAYAA